MFGSSVISLKNVFKWLWPTSRQVPSLILESQDIYIVYCIKHILKATKCFPAITDIQATMKRTN